MPMPMVAKKTNFSMTFYKSCAQNTRGSTVFLFYIKPDDLFFIPTSSARPRRSACIPGHDDEFIKILFDFLNVVNSGQIYK